MIDRNDLKIFDTDPTTILASVQADYVALTGKPLQPAQSETLLLNCFAYRLTLFFEQANEAIRNSLVPFSIAPMLDYLGSFVGVGRLPASGALTTVAFVTGGTNPIPVVIPAVTRLATADGAFTFETTSAITLPVGYTGVSPITVEAVCTTPGEAGNGQAPTAILDPVAYVQGFVASQPSGGSDGETDEQLRARIQQAPDSFSSAGPIGAYKFYAKSANASILDVAVITTFPGEVTIYPLVAGGVPSASILAAVYDTCSPEDVRPLCDTVKVAAPGVLQYSQNIELVLYDKADVNATLAIVRKALTEYSDGRAALLGKDVVRDQILSRCMVSTVYSADVLQPAATLVVADNEVAICTSITVTVIGFNHG